MDHPCSPSSLSSSLFPALEQPCATKLPKPPCGDVKPHMSHRITQALCSVGRILRHQTHLTYAVTLRTWEGPSIIKSCSPTLSHPSKALVPASVPRFSSRKTAEGAGCAAGGPHTPVRMDWSTRRVVERISMIRMSAGTLSPTAGTGAEQLCQEALAAPNSPGMGTANPKLTPTMCSLEQ